MFRDRDELGRFVLVVMGTVVHTPLSPQQLELSKTPKPTTVRRVSDSPSDDVRG